ncbi:Ubiquitin carboxyl-terminal hydrolase 34 [Verticillium nonalfalfae]|uniref:Ubiquitin carboxyl-terminal hydrolase 34 n=1 Tax=Verticillium nonalfalfae TaxID=1051616 RepID=A0A3M9YEH6_9PEZI|nr:Ubiquitin carboxyl-terminal hydrolase 34 [Verticillium nonalfalfae]RNJ57510.1 Ubiquitin carboxyl-terminal hydrolase 34 [Verticillium nonalfalfae]
MQETSQRYVDTSQMVSWIKTYDDTMIDIHNQMDVDEFYNLLFDRWESQMASAGKRNAFRAFYGGQLVQQVRSKECDHISERLEPFSAIQCDIKGKTTLLDSLRDYVDGEIMEGENKYKCSTCDRHVDAVKRACLKDIPDNLIFHLKRFDFNLRTLTRSKINDYFSFPNRIDMRPYTVEYLNQESPTSEEDVFELVGVLVHSGTAESGHYYSYIRERPSTADLETWLEFNDEAVSTWDAAQLEAATFGGPDTNQVNDANSVAYDKSYSAYMLFYQRSSVLRASRQEMQAQGLVPPLHVDIIPDLHEVIKNNNTVFLRRHCLFDRNHAVFALQFFEFMMSFNNGQCSLEHQTERSAMAMLLGHLDQVVGRSKTSVLFQRYKTSLQTRFRNCHKCAEAFLDYFVGRPEAFRQLVQRNPEPSYRLATGDMLIIALEEIREHDPAYYGPEAPPADDEILVQNSAIDGALILFRKIFENFHCNLRSWNECFHLILRFAELGEAETAALLHDDWLKDLMFVIAADANYPGLPEHYVMLVRGLSRRMSNKPPSYDVIIQLINHLMKALEPLVQDDMVEEANERLALYLEDPSQPLPWTSEEVNVLFAEDRDYGGSFFVRRLLEIDQERQDTCAIIRRLAKGDEHMQKCVTRVLGNMISGKAEMHSMVPFLWAALTFVTHCNDPDTSQQVLQHVTQACRVLENNEGKSFLDFFQRAIQALVCMPLAEAKPGLMMHLELVPLWGPGLIGCVDKRSASLAQQWIEGFLVRYETQWAHEDAELHDRVVQAARQLGVGCLQYLQEQYVLAERQVVGSTIEPLHKMIVASEAYFEIDIDGGVSREGFHHLKEGKSKTWILESVERLLIDELDEDGSDWEDSSSDQMKSMTDVQLRALSG